MTTTTTDQITLPPTNQDAEILSIGGMLCGTDSWGDPVQEVREILTPDRTDWYSATDLAAIASSIYAVHDNGDPVTVETVCLELHRRGILQDVGGASRLHDMRDAAVSAATAKSSARDVREAAEWRRLWILSKDLMCAVEARAKPAAEIAEKTQQRAADAVRQGDNTKPVIEVATIDAILSAPPLDYQLSPIVPKQSFVLIYGASGSGKSFVAQDVAYSVASGLPWLGRYPLEQGLVVYIVAEGRAGLGQRTAAWLQHHGLERECLADFVAVRQPINFLVNGDVDDLCRALDTVTGNRAPAVVVVDTLHRCLAGGDENSAMDIGAFISNVGRLQSRYGCSVVVVHHSGHQENRARGSSSLRAAVDMEFRVEQSGQMVTLVSTKAKDAEEPAPIYLRRTVVSLPEGGTSCVIEPQDGARLILGDFEQRVLRNVQDHPAGLLHGEIKSNFVIGLKTMSNGTLNTVLGRLVQRGLLLRKEEGRNVRYLPATDKNQTDDV